MATFTPPTVNETPPVSEYGPEIRANPIGFMLFRHYKPRSRGKNVYLMADNTVVQSTGGDPWQGTVNDAALPASRTITHTFYGGHVGETITAAQQTQLVNAGLGAYIT